MTIEVAHSVPLAYGDRQENSYMEITDYINEEKKLKHGMIPIISLRHLDIS